MIEVTGHSGAAKLVTGASTTVKVDATNVPLSTNLITPFLFNTLFPILVVVSCRRITAPAKMLSKFGMLTSACVIILLENIFNLSNRKIT